MFFKTLEYEQIDRQNLQYQILMKFQMAKSLLQNLAKSLKCGQQGHQNEPLHYICISKQCQHKPIMCYLCSLEDHHDHQKIVLKLFFDQLLSLQTNSQKVVPLCAKMDEVLFTIKQKLEGYSRDFQNIDLINRTFEQFRILTVSSAMSYYSLVQKINELFNQTNGYLIVQKLNKFIRNYYSKYFAEIQEQEWSKVNISEQLLFRKIQALTFILETLEKLKTTHKLNDYSVLGLFPLAVNEEKRLKVYFSQDLKPSCMTLISPTQAKMEKTGSQRLLILEPCLSKTSSVKKWGVKIIKLASWIGVGVCHINEIKKANYMFNYSNTGHGNYLISSNGYSWSSYKKQYNSKFQSFQYTTGDVIHVEYSPKENMVRFKKQSDPTQPTYQIQVQTTDDPIYPQINLTGLNDQVEIINF